MTCCCQGYWSVAMGAQNAIHRAWCLVHFLDVFGSFQICSVIANKSSWNAAWDIKLKRRSNYYPWNRWIRKQEQLSQRQKVQACDCSTRPRPFCLDYLPYGFSIVVSSLLKAMHPRFPARLFWVQTLYRLPFPSIRVIPRK